MSKFTYWFAAFAAMASAGVVVAADLPIQPVYPARAQAAPQPQLLPIKPVAMRMEAAPEGLPIKQVAMWHVREGDRLRSVVQSWAERANWRVLWTPAEIDFIVGAGRTCQGELVDAMACLFDSIPFDRVDPKQRIRVEMHTENTPPLVLILRDQGTKQ